MARLMQHEQLWLHDMSIASIIREHFERSLLVFLRDFLWSRKHNILRLHSYFLQFWVEPKDAVHKHFPCLPHDKHFLFSAPERLKRRKPATGFGSLAWANGMYFLSHMERNVKLSFAFKASTTYTKLTGCLHCHSVGSSHCQPILLFHVFSSLYKSVQH